MGLFSKKPKPMAPMRAPAPPIAAMAAMVPTVPKPGQPPMPGKRGKPSKPPKVKHVKPEKQPKPPKPGKVKHVKPEKPPKPAKVKQAKPGKPPKQPKAKPARHPKGLVRGVVDPADFIALRFEMVDLRARLEASEQAKAMVETRLAALDAGNAMSRPHLHDDHAGIEHIVQRRIAEVEAQLDMVAAAAAAASATAETAAARAIAAAEAVNAPGPSIVPVGGFGPRPVAHGGDALGAPSGPASPDPALVARVDALTAMVDAQHLARPDPGLGARVDELLTRIESVPDASRLVELEARIEATPSASRLGEIEALIADLAAKISEPPAVPTNAPLINLDTMTPAGPDPETAARLDDIASRVSAIDAFAGQLAALNARVSAQAEVGAQLSSLTDRIGELSNASQHQPAPSQPAVDDDLREHVHALTQRVEGLAERVETTEATSRRTAEQFTAIENRMSAVSIELANQIAELGRDLDGNRNNGNGNGHGENGNGHVSAELLAELQHAQVKLAAEQARYEIAFRQDLATLAEHVRRTKGA